MARGAGGEVTSIQFKVNRCPIPIIWLDTSILLKLGRIKKGSGDRDPDRDRILSLRDNIYELVRMGKLICPDANQSREYLRDSEYFSDVVNELSLGVTTVSPEGLQFKQEFSAIRAYVRGASEIVGSIPDLFSRDPVATLNENAASRVFITILNRFDQTSFDRRKGACTGG